MSYSEFLAKTIKDSGYSLRAIAILCKEKYNVDITAAYLSKLQKESKNPASEKVNIAIAKVCGINPEDLLFEADFQKSPESVRELINQFVNYQKDFLIQVKAQIYQENEETKELIDAETKRYLDMSTREFIQEMIKYKDFFSGDNPMEFDFSDIDESFKDISMQVSIKKTLVDDSMFPIIKQGAKLEIVELDEYKNGDIVYVLLENGKSIVRTYADAGKNVVLIPANSDFETLTVRKDKIKINGKIKSYTIEL